jgi:hypothetical protein
MRSFPFAALPAACALAACGGEPENIQEKAENTSRMLEQRANEIEAEAANGVDAAAAPLENEANLLLAQPGNGAGATENSADGTAGNAAGTRAR